LDMIAEKCVDDGSLVLRSPCRHNDLIDRASALSVVVCVS